MVTTIIPQSTCIILRPKTVEFHENVNTSIPNAYLLKTNNRYILESHPFRFYVDSSLIVISIQIGYRSINIQVGAKQHNNIIVTGNFLVYVTENHDITDVTFNPAIYPVIEYSA